VRAVRCATWGESRKAMQETADNVYMSMWTTMYKMYDNSNVYVSYIDTDADMDM